MSMSIEQIQNLLSYLGYYKGKVDGISGPLTEEATEKFQNAYNTAGYGKLDVDGVAGINTQNALPNAVYKGLFASNNTTNVTNNTISKPIINTNTNTNTQLWNGSKYFTASEFTCKCGCGTNNMNKNLIKAADKMRQDLGPCIVTSGHRCVTHNAKVGGVANSRHLQGKAMDFYIRGLTSNQTLNYIKENFIKKGIIRYAYAINDRCVHMDVT